MVSKNEIKLITSLQQKKYRNKHQLFVVEGVKSVNEFVQSGFDSYKIYTTDKHLLGISSSLIQEVTYQEIKKLSSFKTASDIIGIFRIPKFELLNTQKLQLVLDGIKDPGNLGTIIRLCDWFGLSQLICSKDTVDCFNPKVVQASMGSLSRIQVVYVDIKMYLEKAAQPVYISEMHGKNVYHQTLDKSAILVMGNEANGISNTIKGLADQRIAIPGFGENSRTESLNVATATAILLSEFKRQEL